MFQKLKVLFYLLFYGLSIQSQSNSLVIFSASGNPFYLYINHEQINKTAQSDIKVFDISTGWNFIEIKIPGIIKELRYKDSILLSSKSKFLNKEFTYVLIEKDGKLDLQFKSVSEQSGPSVPLVPEPPTAIITTSEITSHSKLFEIKNNKPLFSVNYNKETSSCTYELTDQDIESTFHLFKKTNDDEAKYRYLNQIIEFNCFKSNQLKDLIDQLSVDMDKLNLAQKAYSHVTDKENVKLLSNSFKFDAVKTVYLSFITDQENIAKQKKMLCKQPIDDLKFQAVFNKIKNTTEESEKINMSKKYLVDMCLSSTQIKQWSELFMHDREKLEFMKNAFYILTDKENKVSLADEFQYRETKNEFLKYMNQQNEN